MTKQLNEFLSLTPKQQKKWMESVEGEQFQISMIDFPIVGMFVDIDDVFEERAENFSDYDHGLFFHNRSISEERRNMIEEGASLTDEEKIEFREFMLTTMIGEEIFDDKVTVARWVDVERDNEKLGAVFYGSDSPFMGSHYDFLGVFKNHEEVKEALTGFGDLVDPSHHYD
jgi:hypothetical protein